MEDARERLVAGIYGALLGTADWSGFLATAASLLPDGRATLLHHDSASQGSAIGLQANYPEAMQRAYNEHFARINPWMPHAARRRVGIASRTAVMVPDGVLGRTEFHAGFLKPLNIRGGIGITIDRTGTLNFNLSIVGADDRPAAIERAVRTVEAISPHLQQAFALIRKTAGLVPAEAGAPVLESILSVGVLRLGAFGVVQAANPVAAAVLDEAVGLYRDAAGRLASHDAALAAALDALRSIWLPFTGPTRTRRWLIARGDMRLPLQVTLVEVARGPSEAYFLGPEALLILEDPERGHTPLEELRHHFGLTAAEARVLGAMGEGLSVAAVARCYGVSVETVRTHLKRVLSKTDSAGQPELMRLVSRLTSVTEPTPGDPRLEPRPPPTPSR